MREQITDLKEKALAEVEAANSTAEVTEAKRAFIGKGSELFGLKKTLGSAEPSERAELGKLLNQALTEASDAAEAKLADLAKGELATQLESETLDLTELSGTRQIGSAHIVTQAWEELEDVFVGMGFTVAEGPQVETDWYNFDALNIPKGHPARDGFDTIYVDHGEPGSTLLRTHTSPVQIRAMQNTEPPIYIVAPGRVFRRDTADSTHMPVFHQIEGLVIDKGISMGDLAGTIEAFTTSYFGEGFASRLRPNHFPFTEPSAEFDIQMPDGKWLELGGCGMVHPNVLRAGGIDPEEWSGFAFGFGIDRLALMKFGITDLRDLFTNDLRFLNQF